MKAIPENLEDVLMGLVFCAIAMTAIALVGSQEAKTRRRVIVTALAVFGAIILAKGAMRLAAGDTGLHYAGGKAGPTSWYQEVAAGSLMIAMAVFAHFKLGRGDGES